MRMPDFMVARTAQTIIGILPVAFASSTREGALERIDDSVEIHWVSSEKNTVGISIDIYSDEADLASADSSATAFKRWQLAIQLVPEDQNRLELPPDHAGDPEVYFSLPVPELGLKLIGEGFARNLDFTKENSSNGH